MTWHGKLRYLGCYGTPESRAEYNRIMAEWHAARREQRPVATGSDLTVNELLVAYLDWADGYYRKGGIPTGESDNVKLAVRPLARLYGMTLAREFGPVELKAVRQAMIDGKLCRNEVNRRIRVIVRAFKWTVSEGKLPASVHMALKAVEGLRRGRSDARESEPVRPVEEAMVERIRPLVSRQVWAMVELQRLTGMRPGEVVLMRRVDIDTTGTVWTYTPASHKTEHHGHERRIHLGPMAQAVLAPWLRERPTGYLFSPAQVVTEKRLEMRAARKSKVPPAQASRRKSDPKRPPGERYTANSYRHAIRRACLKAGIPTWHPNQLRHSVATRLRREFGIETTRVVLGHSSANTTLLYAEQDQSVAEAAMLRAG